METLLREGREERDRIIDSANVDFDKLLVDAYESGMSLMDLHMATGISISTLRVRLRNAGAVVRPVGRFPRM